MASLQLLKRKIKTTQNVSKTTKAMQMIAASKLNKAQAATLATRPFVQKISNLTGSAASKLDSDQKHPYMLESKSQKTLLVVFTPDKGLCGAMNTNIIRELINLEEAKDLIYIAVGKKAAQALAIFGKEVVAAFDFGTSFPNFNQVLPLLDVINEEFLNGKVGNVRVLFTNFNSVFSQSAEIKNLLPIKLELEQTKETSKTLFEPSVSEIMPELLRQYLEMNLYQFFLENYLSYQAAQMIAMQNATNNALDLIKDLKLIYNKTRQEKITSEILDISSGGMISGS